MVRAWLAAVGVVLILGCSGILEGLVTPPTPPPSPSWAGTWEGADVRLVITPDGYVELHRPGQISTDLLAPAVAWHTEGDVSFEVGFAGVTTTFSVQEAPYERDGEWRMVFDGVPLVRTGDAPDVGEPFRAVTPGMAPPAADALEDEAPADDAADEPPAEEAPADDPPLLGEEQVEVEELPD